MTWFTRRYLDLLGSIYIYNEHRGYTALERLLDAVRTRWPDERAFIAAIEKHCADERKHYLMFRRWHERHGRMPLFVDRMCGHIDRFVELLFGTTIDAMDTVAIINNDDQFEKLCRVISLTEKRGYKQVETLLRHPIVRTDRGLMKIFHIIEQDEPSHWAPYDRWLGKNSKRAPVWWERAIDSFIHSELLFLKLPVLFLSFGVRRREDWPDETDTPRASRFQEPVSAVSTAPARTSTAAALMTKAAAEDMSLAAPMAE